MNSPDVSVLVVDDHAPFRVAAATVLRSMSGFDLVGEASDGAEAAHLVGELRPQLVLMDVHMPGLSGVDATNEILDRWPGTRVILCSTYDMSDLDGHVARGDSVAFMAKEEFGPASLRALWDGFESATRREAPQPD